MKKLPKEAKRVFKGEIFEIFQWPQKMFDGTYQIFERVKRDDTVVVVAVKDGKLILLEEEQPDTDPFLTLCAGRVEKSEEPLATAKRELLEETGLESNDWESLHIWGPGGKIIWDEYTFIARDCRKVGKQNLDAGEKIKVLELDFTKFLKMIEDPRFRVANFTNYIYKLIAKGKLDGFKQRLFKR